MTIDPQVEIRAVWNSHPDESYRRDQSHWRDEGRWQGSAWERIGQFTRSRLVDLYRCAGQDFDAAVDPVVLEWGPGGGSNLYSLATWARKLYGVDISSKNLGETARVVAQVGHAEFRPILLEEEPASIAEKVVDKVDLFVSTAVFQHFPSPEYGAAVLDAVRPLMAPGGLGYIQIRYDDGNPKYRPKGLENYRQSHITANSYPLSAFWQLLNDAGFTPIKIADLDTKINYAGFYFTA